MHITERKRREAELQQRVEQLAQADRLKDEFLAVLAHELRNPLASLRNAVEVMRLRDVDDSGLRWARVHFRPPSATNDSHGGRLTRWVPPEELRQ